MTGNQTSDPLVCRPAHNLLSHTSQGEGRDFKQGLEEGKKMDRQEYSESGVMGRDRCRFKTIFRKRAETRVACGTLGANLIGWNRGLLP